MCADTREENASIRRLVRRVVYRTLGKPLGSGAPSRQLITAEDMSQASADEPYSVPEGAILTPLARQVAMERNIELNNSVPSPVLSDSLPSKTIALGADHGGYTLKEEIKSFLVDLAYEVTDVGTKSTESVDYPDFAFAVARLVASGKASAGIVIDGAGIGSCMAANKVPGIRASMCYDLATAKNSREHNGANVLTLGSGMIGPNLARQIVQTWLDTPTASGRHLRRVNKIMDIEQRFING